MVLSGSLLRSERYVLAIEAGALRRKILQVQFSKRDGSLFVTFPYFEKTDGIVSLATVAPGRETTMELEPGGQISSHSVKYSHHPDGNAHFSQTGRVVTSIRKKAIPLSEASGHLFTVHAQGIERFAQPTPKDERDKQPNPKRTYLSFVVPGETQTVKLVGRLYSLQGLAERLPSGVVRPVIGTVLPDGTVGVAFVCSGPEASPSENTILILSCEPLPRFAGGPEASLLFMGGFDPPSVTNDFSKATSALSFSYPVANAKELRERLGSIDFVPGQPKA